MDVTLKRRLYQVLEDSHPNPWANRAVEWPLMALIVANVAAVALETVESFHARHAAALLAFEIISVAIFTVEYLARLWVCTEHPQIPGESGLRTRLRFVVTPFALIDLLAILPFYLSLLFPLADTRILRVFRLLRLLKLARYSPAMATLGRVIVDERRALAAALLIMLGLIMIAATLAYHVEREAQPEAFSSIPQAMWWALATLTTVGYGDVVPVTAPGRLIGGLVMIFGLAMFALPIGIIASGFSSEIHRRDFVVTWGMVARVPLFARLDAISVSRITNLLRARMVTPGTTIFHKGDTSEAMYFIASGQIEVLVPPKPVILGEGDFFGEMALLRSGQRGATIRALTRCRLLVLDKADFQELMATDGDFRQAVSRVAEQREAAEPETGVAE